jgi:hypothetical protein
VLRLVEPDHGHFCSFSMDNLNLGMTPA